MTGRTFVVSAAGFASREPLGAAQIRETRSRSPKAVAGRETKIRVAFLIRSLNRGGAERQLAELATGLDPHLFDVIVLTFYPGGAIWDELTAHATVRLESLEKQGRWDVVDCTWRLTRVLRRWQPDILHTYLVEPSIYGLAAARLSRVPAVVWGVRASNVDYSRYGRANGLTFLSAGWLSRFADVIVANSEAGRLHHIARGYSIKRFITIPNGIDTERFRPWAEARAATRAGWRITPDELVIGSCARLDPIKDHPTLLAATAKLARRSPGVRLVCCGGGSDKYLRKMRGLAADLGISDRVVWAGEQQRMETVYPAFDVLCSSSSGEGFSNSIGEAMSCGVPCAVTDVGDSAAIVASTGVVTLAGDADALAEAMTAILSLTPADRFALGQQARDRIVASYATSLMVSRTIAAYRDLLHRHTKRGE